MAFLELEQVAKRFVGATAVESFTLAVEQGEFVSFLGSSGCGKTTTLRLIAGFEQPTAGTIRIAGADVTQLRPAARHVGMVFQSYALFPNLTVADNVGFGLKVAHRPPAAIRASVAEMLDLVGLTPQARRYPHQLSGGQQQRVALARALAIQPRVLLLDEPLSALDAQIRESLRGQIRSIQRRLGITTIYVTHDQQEALALSDRIVVMRAGRIEQIGTPFAIYNAPQTPFVADFIGTLNRLPATVVDGAAGRLRVGEQDVVAATSLPGVPAGQAVTIALRPEALALSRQPPDGANHLRGIVDDVTFLGATVRVRLQCGGTALVVDTFNHPHLALPQPGDAVAVTFPPEAVLVLGPVARLPEATTVGATATQPARGD